MQTAQKPPASDESCPKCKTDLRGNPIPEEHRQHYGGRTHFLLQTSLYARSKDRTHAFECPFCGHQWKA